MGKLEVFQNGNFSDGRPVFQVGSKNEDGTYTIADASLMSEEEAKARLEYLQPAPTPEPKKEPVKRGAVRKTTAKGK
jgi:hypothetical protein|tara:strand:+ start:215 stop:445 length:231 start_codon:yes stop_codon:yes gene_type:complete